MKYLLGLLLSLFLLASLARADGIDNFALDRGAFGIVAFSLPATEPFNGFDPATETDFTATFPFNFDGGVIGGVVEFFDPTFGAFAITGIISYPPGWFQDPTKSPGQLWPFDYNNSLPDRFGDNVTPMFTINGNSLTFIPGNYGGRLTITATPEPATLTFLFAGLGALALRKRLAPRDVSTYRT
jgi:hypothetical protein